MKVKVSAKKGRASLGRQKILDAALEIVKTEELNQLSIRRLAAALHASPMGIYFYFPSKADLVDAVLKAFVDKADVTGHGVDPADWKRWVAITYFSIFTALREMPGIVPYMGDLRLFGPAGLKVNQKIRSALSMGGISRKLSHQMSLALLAQTIGYVVLDLALVGQRKSLSGLKAGDDGDLSERAQVSAATEKAAAELTNELRHLNPEANLELFMSMIEKSFRKA